MENKKWPFRANDREWLSFLKFDKHYHKTESYSRYVSKTGLCYGLRSLGSNKLEVFIIYCLRNDLPKELVIPKEFEGLPVDFAGYLQNPPREEDLTHLTPEQRQAYLNYLKRSE